MSINLKKKWRLLPEFPNYFISESGEVFSLINNRKLKDKLDRYGYKVACISNFESKRKYVPIHRLVAKGFVNKLNPNYNMVNHIDGNKLNNHYSNLEWCNNSMNVNHGIRLNLSKNHANIFVYDTLTNKTTKYYSLKSFCRDKGLNYTHYSATFRYSLYKPILGRYIIVIEDINHFYKSMPNSKSHGITTYVYDKVNNKKIRFSSLTLTSYYTCINSLHRKLNKKGVVDENGYIVSILPKRIKTVPKTPYEKFLYNIEILKARFKKLNITQSQDIV